VAKERSEGAEARAEPLTSADPQPGETQPYHICVQRHEPGIVFGTIDRRVAIAKRDDGSSLLDDVWAKAPYSTLQIVAILFLIAGLPVGAQCFQPDDREQSGAPNSLMASTSLCTFSGDGR